MQRRDFLKVAGLSLVSAGIYVSGACAPRPSGPLVPFPQGVACGLHGTDAVVLWTRVEPGLFASGDVTWQVAASPAMTDVIASGSVALDPATDHTVKVLVEGLPVGQNHWYRFAVDGEMSPVGRARTLPPADSNPERLSLAFASCQSFATGYYGAWRDIAARDVDAVVFLGDYIYEAAPIQLLRRLRDEPLFDATTVDDYRAKYRHYRSDADLQAAHAAHPWVPVWDDHEMHNDWDRTAILAEPTRHAAAMQAWFEYQPVWPTDGARIHRRLRWGRLCELTMLDSRTWRDASVPSIFGGGFLGPEASAPGRTMLGVDQRDWLLDGLSVANDDGVTWNAIGNPQPIGALRALDLDTPELRAFFPDLPDNAGFYFGLESWDAFPVERERILGHLHTGGIGGTTFLSGDVHAFWAGGLRADPLDLSSPLVAHDFAGGAISSPPGGPHTAVAESNAELRAIWDFVDGGHNGYGLIEYRAESAVLTFVGVDATTPNPTPAPIHRQTVLRA